MNQRLLSFFFALFTFVISYGQQYSFINYSIEDGLPQSQVSSFVQDNDGYLWIGTMGGLAQFNGNNFYSYTRKDHLLNNRITSLNFRNDSIFIGQEGGFSIHVNKTFSSFSFDENDKSVVTTRVFSFKNKIYAFTNGSGFYYLKGNELLHKKFDLPDENRIREALVYQGKIYLATRAGLLRSNDGIRFEIVLGTEVLNLSGLSVYAPNELVFSTFDSQVGIINLKKKTLDFLPVREDIVGLRNCFADSKDRIWVPYSEGIVMISSDRKIMYINKDKGLSYDNISTVYEDNNQTIWLGSAGKGIYKFAGNHILRYTFENESKSDLVLASLRTKDFNYYGTYDGGLIIQNKINGKTNVVDTKSGSIWALTFTPKGELLVGTDNGLLKLSNDHSRFITMKFPKEITSEKVTCLLSRGNSVYLGGSFGILKFSQDKIESFAATKESDLLTVRNLANYNQQIYIGCDNGLFALINDHHIVAKDDFKNKINSLSADRQGRLWIGTEDGLFLLYKDSIRSIDISDKYPSNIINFLGLSRKNLIVGTNNGIYYCALAQKANFNFNHIGLEEGLGNLETNINSLFVDNQDNITFGTASGLDVLNINQLEQNYILQPPKIILKNISVNFHPVTPKDKTYKVNYDKNGDLTYIRLPFNRNNLLINLDGISLKDYQSLSYQYKIEGFDQQWSAFFKNPQINITNLPVGKYELKIRGMIGGKLYSNLITFNVEVTPPFYLSAWFILIVSISVVGITFLLIRFRIQRERERNQQEKLEIEGRLSDLEQQSLNASMNRHFIFNSLNSIQYFINTQDKYSANKYLTNFAKLIRKNLDASTENKNMVTLEEEIDRLRLYLELESMRFADRFTYEIDDEDVVTSNYYVPAMLLQPFVENSIIHGILPNTERAGKIEITISDFPNHIEIKIKDNGIGIKKSMEQKGLSAQAHKSKGMEISTNRIHLLQQFYNEGFELIGPFQTTDDNHSISGTTVLIKIPKENL